MNFEAIELARSAKPLQEMNIDDLTAVRDYWRRTAQDALTRKGLVEQEIWLRAKEANPGIETSGTASLAGENVVANVGATREWTWLERPLIDLQRLCRCGKPWEEHHRRMSGSRVCRLADLDRPEEEIVDEFTPILTDQEYSDLVTFTPKVDGRLFNAMLRRGGHLALALHSCRTFKSARPTIDVKARS